MLEHAKHVSNIQDKTSIRKVRVRLVLWLYLLATITHLSDELADRFKSCSCIGKTGVIYHYFHES